MRFLILHSLLKKKNVFALVGPNCIPANSSPDILESGSISSGYLIMSFGTHSKLHE
jgi:hypothetical protein